MPSSASWALANRCATQELNTAAARNQVLMDVAVAYVELLRAECRRAISLQIRADNAEVARLTAAYARVGEGRKADADRAATELTLRETDTLEYEGDVLTRFRPARAIAESQSDDALTPN